MTAPLFAALTAALVVRTVAPPRQRLSVRLRPYLAVSRSLLGSGTDDPSAAWLVVDDDRSAWGRIFELCVEAVVRRLSVLFDVGDDEQLALRLRQAGLGTIDPLQYRMRQLVSTVAGLAAGVVLGAVLLRSVSGTLFLMVSFGLPAATFQRGRLDRALTARCSRMRSEVYTITQLIAVRLRTGHGPVESIRAVVDSCSGPVADELGEGLRWMASGVTPTDAYVRLAVATPEPAAGRLYRLLGASATTGGDIAAALLAIGVDQRAERRDEIGRLVVKRRTAMVVPLLLLIAPVMIVFVGAAVPSMILGPLR